MGFWKALSKWEHLVSVKFSFMVGGVERVKLWKDSWCEYSPLNISFLLYSLVLVQKRLGVGM